MQIPVLFFCLVLSGIGWASGPPRTVGHLDIELLGSGIRASLGIPYNVAQNAGGFAAVNSSQAFTDELFAKTLGEKPLLSDGERCTWGKPVSVVSFVAIRLQATAICPRPPQQLTIELPFLRQAKANFRTSVQLHPHELSERVEMSRQTPIIILNMGSGSAP